MMSRSIGPEIKTFEDSDQLREAVLHLLTCAKLTLVVEVGLVDYAFEVVSFGKPTDDLIDFVADLLVALQSHHVGKATIYGYFNERVSVSGVLV